MSLAPVKLCTRRTYCVCPRGPTSLCPGARLPALAHRWSVASQKGWWAVVCRVVVGPRMPPALRRPASLVAGSGVADRVRSVSSVSRLRWSWVTDSAEDRTAGGTAHDAGCETLGGAAGSGEAAETVAGCGRNPTGDGTGSCAGDGADSGALEQVAGGGFGCGAEGVGRQGAHAEPDGAADAADECAAADRGCPPLPTAVGAAGGDVEAVGDGAGDGAADRAGDHGASQRADAPATGGARRPDDHADDRTGDGADELGVVLGPLLGVAPEVLAARGGLGPGRVFGRLRADAVPGGRGGFELVGEAVDGVAVGGLVRAGAVADPVVVAVLDLGFDLQQASGVVVAAVQRLVDLLAHLVVEVADVVLVLLVAVAVVPAAGIRAAAGRLLRYPRLESRPAPGPVRSTVGGR